MYFISFLYKIFLVLLVLSVLYIFYSFFKILEKHYITINNFDFIRDIYEKLNNKTKIKVDNIVKWHKKHSHPFLVERSIKINKIRNKQQKYINNNRVTIVISLSYFFKDMKGTIDEKKWIEWRDILEIPKDIEAKCLENLVSGNGSVDFIWGIDLNTNKEKIYLENPRDNKIYSYIFPLFSSEIQKKTKETYEYHKISNILDKFRFYYKRFNLFNNADSYTKRNFSNEVDSYHFFLKEVIRINNCVIHIVSVSKNTATIYYYYLK